MMNKNSFLLLLLCFVMTSGFAQKEVLTPEKLWDLGRVSLEDVSPDGSTVLYGITYYDVSQNKGNKDLYILPAKGGVPKKITAFEGSEYNAQYRPDGEKIGFLHGGMLWEMNPDGTDKNQISKEQVNGFKYAPDLKHILFIKDVKYRKETAEIYPDLPKANVHIIDDLMYRHWDSWDDKKNSNVFVIKYENGKLVGEAKNIQNEAYDAPLQPFGGMEQINWSPDGRYIAYTSKKLSGKDYAVSTNSDIYIYDMVTGETKNISKDLPGYDMEPSFSPNGRYLAWNSMARNGFEADRNRIYIYDFQEMKKWEITEGLDLSTNHPQWSNSGRAIFCVAGKEATYQLASIGFENKQFSFITEGRHNYYDFKYLGKGTLVGRKSTMLMPHELFRVTMNDSKEEQLTFTNEKILKNLKNAEVKGKTIKTTDNKDMLVWTILPPDFDPNKKYPTLLYCQGGPQSAVSQFWSYRWNFQLMAANGYVIIAPNRRGLPTFGREWNDAISKDWGGQAMKDYLSAIDDAAKETYVDEDNIGAIGASYGGYSVFWLAGNHDKRFKTFISHDGLFNLESWYGTTEELFFANWDIGGPYWKPEMKEYYEKHSPHNYVRNWDTPMLIIQGGIDFRVPPGEGLQAFQVNKLLGNPSKLLYFPEENHWILSPQNGVLWHREFYGWLDKYLK